MPPPPSRGLRNNMFIDQQVDSVQHLLSLTSTTITNRRIASTFAVTGVRVARPSAMASHVPSRSHGHPSTTENMTSAFALHTDDFHLPKVCFAAAATRELTRYLHRHVNRIHFRQPPGSRTQWCPVPRKIRSCCSENAPCACAYHLPSQPPPNQLPLQRSPHRVSQHFRASPDCFFRQKNRAATAIPGSVRHGSSVISQADATTSLTFLRCICSPSAYSAPRTLNEPVGSSFSSFR